MNLRPVEHFFPHFDLFAMSKSSMYLMCQIHWIVSGSLNYRSFRDITAGNIQMPPLRWWAESTLPPPLVGGRDRAKVTKNLGAPLWIHPWALISLLIDFESHWCQRVFFNFNYPDFKIIQIMRSSLTTYSIAMYRKPLLFREKKALFSQNTFCFVILHFPLQSSQQFGFSSCLNSPSFLFDYFRTFL